MVPCKTPGGFQYLMPLRQFISGLRTEYDGRVDYSKNSTYKRVFGDDYTVLYDKAVK